MIEEEIGNAREAAGLYCPRCEAANLPHRKFCAKCGAPLWEPCFRCGEVCSAGENFCGTCGANLSDAVAEQLERVGDDFRAVAEMRDECRFEEAIARLTPIAKNAHPRMAERAARASQLIRQMAAERDRRRIVVQDALARARKSLDAFDHDGAALILDQVPPALRNAAIEEMNAEVNARRDEFVSLNANLREAVREKRILEMPALIERLLAVKPDHAYAIALAEQVRNHLVAAAGKHIAEYRYDDAVAALDLISPHLRNANSDELRRQAGELAWLAWDLRNATVVDATLAAVAERLRKLASGDERTVKICDEVARRFKLAEAKPKESPPTWARPPRETPLGAPVEALPGFRRLICSKAASEASDILRFPGRFAIACGLALAGIGQGALRVNLQTAEEKSLLSKVSRMMRFQTMGTAWGLDLGMGALKAVRLSWNLAKKQATIESAASVEHAKPLSHAVNEAEEHRLVAESLKTFLATHPIKGDHVCVGLPSRAALARQFDLPPVDAAKAPRLVEFEAQQQFPFPLDQLAWDYQFLDAEKPVADAKTKPVNDLWRRALLIGAQSLTVKRYADAFRRVGIHVNVMQTDFVAVYNFLAHEQFPLPNESPSDENCRVAAAIEIGCDVTNIVVGSPQSLWFHSCGVAGQSFTRALVRELKLSVAQAEQMKRSPQTAERFTDAYDAMAPVFDDLLKEVQHSLAAYASAQPDLPIDRIFGLGGGFALHGLPRFLRCGR